MREQRPFYTVQVTLYGCAYDIRLNDGPVFESAEGYPGTVELPANPWLKHGDNTLSLLLRPMPGVPTFDRDTDCEAVVYVRESGQERSERTEVTRLRYAFATGGPAPQPGSAEPLRVDKTFALQLPRLPRWRWLSSRPIRDPGAALRQLASELETWHGLLRTGDVEALLATQALRDEEMAAAYYQPPEVRRTETRRELEELVSGADGRLADLSTTDLTLRVFGGGRLARLDDPEGESPIHFLQSGSLLVTYLPLVFTQSTEGRWTICR
jgi:hypothetical protein